VDAKVTQTSGWVEYGLETDYQRALLVAGVDERGSVAAAAVGFVSQPRWPLRGFSTIRFPAYPSTGGDPSGLGEAIAACERVARERGHVAIEFRGSGQSGAAVAVRPSGYTVQEKLEYVLDLTHGEEELWRRLNANHRRNVAKSRVRGVRVVPTQSLESLHTLRAMQVEVARRHAASDDPFGLQAPRDYDALHRTLLRRGLGRVYCAYADDKVVSGLLVVMYGTRARVLYVGSTEQGYEVSGAFALYWQSITDLSREGFVELSLGSAGTDAGLPDPGSPAWGLHRFKLGFGPRVCSVETARKELRPAAVRVHKAVSQWRMVLARWDGRTRLSRWLRRD
jgi:hypothetical protein